MTRKIAGLKNTDKLSKLFLKKMHFDISLDSGIVVQQLEIVRHNEFAKFEVAEIQDNDIKYDWMFADIDIKN